jgi:Mrp family chromosome partitioning ATPase
MGRMFEVLRQAERALRSREESPADKAPGESPAPVPSAEPEDKPAVSFIEVGPRQSIDGSPDVLACSPVRRPVVVVDSEPGPEARVVFRPLPAHPRPDAGRPRLAPELVAFHSPALPAAEQYRNLLAALLPASGVRGDERCPVLVFTASQDEAGATTVVLNLAITAARQGRRRVIVVDGNLRRPAVADRLGLEPAPGLREVLLGTATLDQALRPTVQPHLLALTAGLAEAGAGPRFVAGTTRSLLRHLRQRADLVLVDGPPWDGRPEAGLLATAADAVYLVLPEKEAETPQADDLLQAIVEYGAKLAGCVLAGR